MRFPRVLAAVGVTTALALAGCSGDSDPAASAASPASDSTTGPTSSVVDRVDDRTIIDVRTPAEHAAGHLEGAVNLDVQDPSFDERVGELPTDGSYLVYCRSGNRSAAAVARMAQLGFTDVVDGGAMDSLVAAGLPTA